MADYEKILQSKIDYYGETKAAYQFAAEQYAREEVEEITGMSDTFTLSDILNKLIESSDILLHNKNYDGHGWEIIAKCTELAKEKVKQIENHIINTHI